MVDLPTPGAPPIKTKEPFTIPPPKILSNSLTPVLYLISLEMSIADRCSGGETLPLNLILFEEEKSFISSFMVFPCPQDGQIPFHLADSKPH